ncbi:MAG: terminal oxidase subunit, partial [Chloroflexi bacterium]|nr:terminal oxidase subunit [Chloroflexota bacterium]
MAQIVLVFLWAGITAYVLFGGADFGAGLWDLLAGGPEDGARERARIEHSIGPVWEANHVWLIFALVVVWTAFPTAFAAIMATLSIPLTAVAFGVILRGSAFAFRKSVTEPALQRLFGASFALSSVVTPFFLGTSAGAIASGRVPTAIGDGDVLRSWLTPSGVLGGTLAVGICSYLAAVYLCADARRSGESDLAERFRRRALLMGVLVGVVALGGIVVLQQDAPRLFGRLTGPALPLIFASGALGLASLALLTVRRYLAVRVTAALAVVGV